MSAHTSGFSPSFAGRRTGGRVGLLGRVLSGLSAWRERRAVSAELAGLNERELNDIGLTRDDLPRVFDASFVRAFGRI